MNTCWYIHTATLYQLSCSRTLDNIYIPQLYMNFSADEHVVIYTGYNFILTFLQMNTWWYTDTATLYQLFCRWTRCNIYMLQLYINFSADEHLMIYTYRNFVSLCYRWTPDDIYRPKLYINFPAVVDVMIYTYRNFIFPADKHVVIYTYGNFISTFLQMSTWWYIHTATLYQFFSRRTRDDIYTATLYQLSCSWTPDDIYVPQLYINFPADEHVMIYIYTATLYQLSCRWTRDDIYIPQLYINFPADEHLMIYTYRNFISTFLQMKTWWYVHTEI